MQRMLTVLLLVLLGGVWVAGGVWMCLRQHQMIAGASRVTGRVLTSEVQVSRRWDDKAGKHERHFEAAISYEYTVNGRRYECSRVGAVAQPASEAATRAIVDAYPVGAACTVHYDPAWPGQAFLLAQYRVTPYVVAICGLPLICLIPAAMTGAMRAEGEPLASMNERLVGWGVCAVLWHGAGLLLLSHWLLVCHQPAGVGLIGLLLAFHAVGIAPAVAARRAAGVWLSNRSSGAVYPANLAPRWE